MDDRSINADRRNLLRGAAVVAGASAFPLSAAPRSLRVIATEESFATPAIAAATRQFMMSGGAAKEPGLAALIAGFSAANGKRWSNEALDFGAVREAAMVAAGVDTQLLLIGAPGVQIFDAAQGTALAADANELASTMQAKSPARYAALATIAPQDPRVAALELERSVRKLGLKGGLINSHTHGEYLDDPKFWPIFEAAQALDVPIYIHPRDPSPAMLGAYQAHSLLGPIWGFAAETGLHALRLIMAGVFDEFPKLRIVLGHLGEGLPFFINRIDIRYAIDGSPARRVLKLRPSDYLRRNFALTTSGMNFGPSVRQAIDVMGVERIMFAADWPYEDAVQATRAFAAIRMSTAEKRLILHANAERIFRIDR